MDEKKGIYLPAYVRRFSDREMKKENTEVSKWFPGPMRNALIYGVNDRYGFIRDSDYVIGPLYTDGDLQIGVTGGVEVAENIKIAAAREMGEEIGLVPSHLDELQTSGRGVYGNKNMQTYNIYYRHCRPVLDSQNGISMSSGRDSKTQKVGVIVYGSKEQIVSFLDSDAIYIYQSADDLQGVGAFKIKNILKLMKNGSL